MSDQLHNYAEPQATYIHICIYTYNIYVCSTSTPSLPHLAKHVPRQGLTFGVLARSAVAVAAAAAAAAAVDAVVTVMEDVDGCTAQSRSVCEFRFTLRWCVCVCMLDILLHV